MRAAHQIENEPDVRIKSSLIRLLGRSGLRNKIVIDVIEGELRAGKDEVQAAAIFSDVQLNGRFGLARLRAMIPVGEVSKKQKESSLEWLETGTSENNPFGLEVESDQAFVDRFGDLDVPVMRRLRDEGLVNRNYEQGRELLPERVKGLVLESILEARGFGLEAVKGQLFRSLGSADEEMLLRIRSANWFSPNALSMSRHRTIDILVRRCRQMRVSK